MKRFFVLVLVFFAIYFGIQIAFKFTVGGYENQYEIRSDKTYTVKEVYTVNRKSEHDNYYVTISDGTNEFVYQIYKDLNKVERIVKDIKSFEDESYHCILPIFRDGNRLEDITCLSNGIQYYYRDLKGKDVILDSFVSTLSEEEYSLSQFEDHASPVSYDANVTFYQDNIVDGHFLGTENYRGLYMLNSTNASSLYESSLFNKDIYNKRISAIVGKYYVVADYDSDYEFHKFHLVDLKTLKKETIEYHNNFSFDSYVQGVVDNSLYFFDKNSKKQYELNIKTKSIVEIGNVDLKIKYYDNGTWTTVSAYDAVNQNLYFNSYDVTKEFTGYTKVDKVGQEFSGFYYFYKKVGNGYEVYRSNIQEKTKLTYLFQIDNLSSITYLNDYIYFIKGDTIHYYHDETGLRKLYRNSELKFNSNLIFGICD